MSKDENCCDICALVDKYVNYIKVCENDTELEFNVRKAIETAYNLGITDCIRSDIAENIALLESLTEDEEELEQEKPNLKVVDNVKLN